MKALALFSILVSMLLSGCTEKFGQSVDSIAPRATVIKIITDQSLSSKVINIEGTILSECESGCWFFLKDDTGHILVDLAPSHFTIPSKVGKKALVTGTVSREKDDVKVIAKAVEIR
ncbi:MAG: hypothetical protein ACLQVJ_16375 [Syntrophobacteraceae bacterium]